MVLCFDFLFFFFNIQATIRVLTLQQTDTVAIIHSVSRFPTGARRKDRIRWRTGAHVIRRPRGGRGKRAA